MVMGVSFTLLAIALRLILVDFYSDFANANLTLHPKDAVVLVNQPTYFNCSTSARNINANFVLWYHYSLKSATRNDVYDEGNIMFEYKDRFRIEVNLAAGVFNLVVERPSLDDAGRYECQDGVGQGDKASAELIILGENPSCKSDMNPGGVIGQNDCGLEPDVIQLTCNVTSSHGNIPLEWKISGDKSNSSLVVCEPSTSCSLTLKGNLALNNQSLVCQTTKARRQQYGCSIGPVKVKYALSSRVKLATEGDVKCYANTSQPCSYKWYNAKNEEVSSDENLGVKKPGNYKCEAQCEMNQQNEPCRFTAMEVEVVSPEPVSGALLALVSIPIIICIVALLIIIGCLCKKDKCTNIFIKKSAHKTLRDNEALMEIPSKKNEVLLETPSKKNEVLMETPSKENEVLLETPSKENEVLLETPKKNEVLMETPSKENEALMETQDGVDSQLESSVELPSLPIITGQNMVDTLTVNQYFIDRGASGAIYGPFKWEHKTCAIKQILYSPDKLTDERKEEITKMRDHCKELDHPHLVEVFEVWFPSPALYILMEYAEGKSLDKILRPRDAVYPLPPFELKIVKDWALQIADGMRYLHGKNLVHRNLKAAHVLVMELPDVSPKTLKIGSYTLAKEHDHSTVMSLKGTMAWMSPEYIRGEPFSMLSDVWSYGVTVWEILTRDVPYKEVRKETDLVRAAINKTLKLTIPDPCQEQLRTVLTKCWNYGVDERPSFTEICFDLEH